MVTRLLPFLLAFSLFGEMTPYKAKDYSNLIGMSGFSDPLLQMHFTLYQGYVKNSNELLAKLQTMSGSAATPEFGALKRRLGWELDGMRLHELYFSNLGGDGAPNPKSPLYQALTAQFGSYEKWKAEFIAVGSMRGIGWAILYLDREQNRLINLWINEHDVGHLTGGAPLLIMDVFEHAYMPQYGLDKAKYIQAFFQNINWPVVDSRWTQSSSQ
jgi:Fe-Mn family superoxide dismutase